MIEFLDKTSEKAGTPINRANMMAIQGMVQSDTVFKSDGSIVVTNGVGHTTTVVFNADGSITETFKGTKTLVKTTKFNSDGSISETIKEGV